jgi:hypothetical protein
VQGRVSVLDRAEPLIAPRGTIDFLGADEVEEHKEGIDHVALSQQVEMSEAIGVLIVCAHPIG